MREKLVCVYKLTNHVNGKIYIGGTVDYSTRLYYHVWYAKHVTLKRPRQPVNDAILEYGWDSFKAEVLETCSRDSLIEREALYIATLRATDPDIGYNVLHRGFNRKGVRHRTEVIAQITETQKRVTPRGAEHHLAGKVNWNAIKAMHAVIDGKPRTEEVKQKMRDKLKGRRCPWAEIAVLQLDPVTMKVIKEWPSRTLATRYFSKATSAANINNCLTLRKNQDGVIQKTAYGFAWRFADQFKEISQ